ncbi:type II toxin-antitoxin system HicB family antitoxin [uncultured Duncaniella sp.]|uniref:type II toxin-antitoxin system HicB family antitoxin n=1 Tax=uncultured Duncaniella sp. TaxID=2768039 RepID=UPI00261F56A7|nr:type II toxin-antitoxin system HicB family antitoxin [uncultured Duncaniella sp.]
MGQLKYKGYTGSVEFSEEDNCLFGRVQGIRSLISYEGDSIESLRADFEEAIDFYLQSCRERGVEPARPYSGRFVVRISSELHSELSRFASEQHSTVNQIVTRAITNELRHAYHS